MVPSATRIPEVGAELHATILGSLADIEPVAITWSPASPGT